MDSARSPPGSVRRHGRNISHPTPRQAARGPLEEATDDPLSDAPQSRAASITSPPTAFPETNESVRSSLQIEPEPPKPKPSINLLPLQDPDSYQQLFVDDVTKAFIESTHQPPLNATLADLIEGGHFRRAAERALKDLMISPPGAAERIFPLLYTRLACLILISRPDVAAQEAIPLIDLLARSSQGSNEILPLVPWDLRLLLVRLQAIGSADGGRRGIMALYGLAGEVRAHIRDARHNGEEGSMREWSERLQDLGLRVCDALVESGELETATRHLDSLVDVDPDELAYRKALLRVRVGDIPGARQSASKINNETRKMGFEALLKVADGDYAAAAETWQSLASTSPGAEDFAQNAAVSLLYTGHIISARDALENLASRTSMFSTLLFNLSTVYELCSERALEQKTILAEQAAAKTPLPASGGWERSAFEFKL